MLEKLSNKTASRLPGKSTAATMMVEAQLISKMQVREAMLNSEDNVLHTDGTKYKFKEIGSYQVNTTSGAYTMGIEEMSSGEAASYMGTFRNLLHEMSSLVVPDDAINADVQKILYKFKCLMTDRCTVNSSFFEELKKWRDEIIPFVIENYASLPDKEKESITRMHHVFCALHVIHNLGLYAETAVKEWEKIVSDENNTQGGFKGSSNSRYYDLLFELSKLTSMGHGDQRNGKADEWNAYLEKLNIKNEMVSFLHHRFNVIFVIGGAAYFHRLQLKDFVNHLERNNFLHESISQDIDSPVFLSAFRALGIFNKLVSGPLFQKIEEQGHVFSLNKIWESLSDLMESFSKDGSAMMKAQINFLNHLRTEDEVFHDLVAETDDPVFETLTQECLEMICCSCSVVIQKQLKDQLPGGKYYQPTNEVYKETVNCQKTNVPSEQDFAQYDRILHMKPTLSTAAACGLIMYSNNRTGEWLAGKSEVEVNDMVEIAMNKGLIIDNYRKRKKEILQHKSDMLERRKVEKEVREQRVMEDKEKISKEIDLHGGLWTSKESAEQALKTVKSKVDALKCQIRFRKTVLGQKFPCRKLGQIGEADDKGKYAPYSATKLKENLLKIIEFASKPPEAKASYFVKQNIRQKEERTPLIEKAKQAFESKKGSENNSKGAKTRKRQTSNRKVPQFFGKCIRHKYEEDGKDVWYKGIVVSCLDENEYDINCEFEVEYEGSEDRYEVKLVEEWKRGWVVIDGKANKRKRKEKEN